MPRVSILIPWLLAAACARQAPAAEARLERTVAALDALEAACRRFEDGGHSALPYRIPLVVGRLALKNFRPPNRPDPDLLDQVYLSALKARVSLLEAMEKGIAPSIPPRLDLAKVSFERDVCTSEGRVVFPVACREKPREAEAFFAAGVFRSVVPALAGARVENLTESEVYRIYRTDPKARRVGWDGPAGGFVCDADGQRPAVLVCLEHPGIRQAIAKETTQALYALDPKGRPLYASLGDDCFYVDYSPFSAEAFIEWLKGRYGTLRVVNAAWGTDFRAFSPQMMPRPEEARLSAARWFDWVDFNRQRLTRHVEWACANVRKVLPQLPLGLSCFRYALAGSRGLSGVDPVALASTLDVLEANGCDPMTLDLAVAVAQGKKPVVDACGEARRFGVLPHLLHGCAAVGLRRWPPAPLDSVRAVEDAARVLRECLLARRLAREIELLRGARCPVALLYSDASMLQVPPETVRCGATPYGRVLTRAYEAARFVGVRCGFIAASAAAAKRWRGAKVVVVAGSPAEEDKVVRGLLDFVELGGELVIIAESLVTDAHGRQADYLARLGIEVLETERPATRADPRPERGGALDKLVEETLPAVRLGVVRDGVVGRRGQTIAACGARQRIRVNVTHEVLATYPDGSAAVVRFRRGKGWVTYFAACPDQRSLSAALSRILKASGLAPGVRLVDPDFDTWGIEWASVRDGGRTLFCLWNTTGEPKRVSLQVAGRPARAKNLVEGKPLPVSEGGLVGPIHLDGGETLLVSIEGGSEE